MLTDVATGKLLIKKAGTKDSYQKRHWKILSIAELVGFDYPVTANTLVEWWGEVKGMTLL